MFSNNLFGERKCDDSSMTKNFVTFSYKIQCVFFFKVFGSKKLYDFMEALLKESGKFFYGLRRQVGALMRSLSSSIYQMLIFRRFLYSLHRQFYLSMWWSFVN